MNEKLVSIIIPFFNRIHWLLEAVESVQKQTYSNWELILVNDGSTDDINEIRSLVKRNPKYLLIEQKNMGVAAARNTGIAIAKGDYVALLDSDDLWDPCKLEAQVTYMEQNGYLISHTCYTLFNDTGIITKVDTSSLEGNILKKLIVSCPLNTSSIVVNKALVDNLKPPFQTGYHYGEDACFLISLAAQAEIGAVRESLTLTRQTETKASDDPQKIRIALINILRFILCDPYLSTFDAETNALLKDIAYLTAAIETQRQKQEKLEQRLVELKPVRDITAREFKKKGFFPKVSIIIPVYNGSNYMRDAIDSALTQTYGNIEVIVINDGSTDNGETENIARAYGDRIRYYAKPNGGVATALNLGIKKMEGEYFSWLSHDDMYTPKKVEGEIRALADLPDRTTVVAEGYQVVNASGDYLYTVDMHSLYSPEQLENSIFLLMRGGINGCALLIHRSHFERVGLFDPRLPTTQDYDLWFRMFRNQPVYLLKSTNVLSRSHDDQGSKTLANNHIEECDKLWIGMMDMLTEKEKIDISGSIYAFYHDLYNFLRASSGYHGAINYSHKQMVEAAISEYEKFPHKDSLKNITDLCGVTPDSIQNELLPLRNTKTARPRIVFQRTYRDSKSMPDHMVIENANILSKEYDVIVYTCGHPCNGEYQSCTSVKEFAVDLLQDQAEHLNILLLLQTDIYICSDCCCKETLLLMEQIKQLGIKTVAWSIEDYFLPYQKENLWDSIGTRGKYLPSADAVVWLDTESLAFYGARYANGIHIPNPPKVNASSAKRYNKDHIYQKWKRLFDALLSSNLGHLEEYFRSEQAVFIKETGRKALEELDKLAASADRKIKEKNMESIVARDNRDFTETTGWKECYMNVINSKSWKLTKPLRAFMGMFKTE